MAVNLNGPLTALQVMQDAPVIPVIVLTKYRTSTKYITSTSTSK